MSRSTAWYSPRHVVRSTAAGHTPSPDDQDGSKQCTEPKTDRQRPSDARNGDRHRGGHRDKAQAADAGHPDASDVDDVRGNRITAEGVPCRSPLGHPIQDGEQEGEYQAADESGADERPSQVHVLPLPASSGANDFALNRDRASQRTGCRLQLSVGLQPGTSDLASPEPTSNTRTHESATCEGSIDGPFERQQVVIGAALNNARNDVERRPEWKRHRR